MNIILQGPPTCGKGTQARLLQQRYPEMEIISIGDLLRNRVIGDQAQRIAQGFLCDQNIINDILEEILAEKQTNLIFDGVPRDVSQLEFIINKGVLIDLVIELTISNEEILKRMNSRMIHKASGRIYNTVLCPPLVSGLDDVTGEPLEKRNDDNIDTLANRIAIYYDSQSKIIDSIFHPDGPYLTKYSDYYRTHKLPQYHKLAADQPIDVVSAEITSIITMYES